VLPRWKPLPGVGQGYPILLTGGHTRWSIHSMWRNEPTMLRLQRGEPSLWLAIEDAEARRIADNDLVRVRNGHGSFQVRARISPGVAPGEAIIYHAVASPYKPVHLVGDYGHLRYRVFASGPEHVPRGVPVEIERAEVA
jgi:nitrate reductase alpha subunit